MAILLPRKADTFEVVVSVDSALDMTVEEFEEYQKTYDKGLLKFKEGQEPTLFVMRKVLPYDLFKKVQSEQLGGMHGDMKVQLGFTSEEVKASLVDIINPASVPEDQQIKYKRGKDGCISEELMELLMAAGIAQELYKARSVVVGTPSSGLKKK